MNFYHSSDFDRIYSKVAYETFTWLFIVIRHIEFLDVQTHYKGNNWYKKRKLERLVTKSRI